MNNKKIGSAGEKQALQYLIARDHKVVTTNWYCRWGEIDIIALKAGIFIFVEVKYRSTSSKGYAYEAFGYTKKLHLKRTVGYFLKKYKLGKAGYRVDLICIDGKNLQHYQNVI